MHICWEKQLGQYQSVTETKHHITTQHYQDTRLSSPVLQTTRLAAALCPVWSEPPPCRLSPATTRNMNRILWVSVSILPSLRSHWQLKYHTNVQMPLRLHVMVHDNNCDTTAWSACQASHSVQFSKSWWLFSHLSDIQPHCALTCFIRASTFVTSHH